MTKVGLMRRDSLRSKERETEIRESKARRDKWKRQTFID